MGVHDWTLVESGIFHAFHTSWMGLLQNTLNNGLLPDGYYALAEQHAGQILTDVLTLHDSTTPPAHSTSRSLAVAEVPPRVRRKQTIELTRSRSVAIRHVSGHRVVALIEIVSPSNKDRLRHVQTFVSKAESALDNGVNLLMIDLFPPGSHDPRGMHGAVVERLEDEPYELPVDEPLTLASYVADRPLDVYLEHLSVGKTLVDMPLFLNPDWYVYVPLQSTYDAAYQGMPQYWRRVLESSEER